MAIAASNAIKTNPSEEYWKKMFPNTSMPKAIMDYLPSVDAANLPLPKDLSHQLPRDAKVKYDGAVPALEQTNLPLPKDLSHQLPRDAKVKYDGVVPAPRSGKYNVEAHLFLLEKDKVPGNRLEVEFAPRSMATFLPRRIANSLPFTSNKFVEILKIFAVKPNSIEAHNIESVLRDCEEPPNEGELQICATSMEAMVDFCFSVLGRNISAFSTTVEGKKHMLKTYTITSTIKQLGHGGSIVCHKSNYAYAVFKCHQVPKTTAYEAP